MFYLEHPSTFLEKSTLSTASDMTSTVLEFLPIIITFAMLGMVLGLLKKFGKI
jgi:hypothetical protein